MADTDRLTEVVAALAERNEEFRPLEKIAVSRGEDERVWPLSELKRELGYESSDSLEKAVNRAKIAAEKSGMSIKDNFVDGSVFGKPGEICVTKYAAYLVITGCDVEKDAVAKALGFFALQVDRQALEDEKRLRGRLDVATENHRLAGVASDRGVKDFQKFNGVGVSALYGGRNVKQIAAGKGLAKGAAYLDFACSEELAANLFRITQTAAALKRQTIKSEALACDTHERVAKGVRQTILDAGNTPPERLPAAKTSINKLAGEVGRKLANGNN